MKRSVNFTGSRATVARRAAQDPIARGFVEAVAQRDALLAALHRIAFEPFGLSDATHEQVLELITQFARETIAKAEVRS